MSALDEDMNQNAAEKATENEKEIENSQENEKK